MIILWKHPARASLPGANMVAMSFAPGGAGVGPDSSGTAGKPKRRIMAFVRRDRRAPALFQSVSSVSPPRES
jgi:hypothetical protein